eukprot:2679867-Rhodomonas_salina.1
MIVTAKKVQMRDEGDQEATRALEMIRTILSLLLLLLLLLLFLLWGGCRRVFLCSLRCARPVSWLIGASGHSRTMSMLFDTEGKLIYSNQSANNFYQMTPTGKIPTTLRRIIRL